MFLHGSDHESFGSRVLSHIDAEFSFMVLLVWINAELDEFFHRLSVSWRATPTCSMKRGVPITMHIGDVPLRMIFKLVEHILEYLSSSLEARTMYWRVTILFRYKWICTFVHEVLERV